MKRVKARDALATLPPIAQPVSTPAETDDAVVLAVRGGEVAVQVSAGTPDDEVLGAARAIHGVIRLENERVLTFRVAAGGTGAAFRDEPAHLHDARAEVGGSVPPARRVADIMTRDVVTTSADMLVEDVAKLLAFHNISGMPVEDWDGTVIGIVSEVDVVDKVGHTIADVMTREVIAVEESTPIEEVAALMADRRIRRVPVLAGGALVGLVTRADIVRAIAARAAAPA